MDFELWFACIARGFKFGKKGIQLHLEKSIWNFNDAPIVESIKMVRFPMKPAHVQLMKVKGKFVYA